MSVPWAAPTEEPGQNRRIHVGQNRAKLKLKISKKDDRGQITFGLTNYDTGAIGDLDGAFPDLDQVHH